MQRRLAKATTRTTTHYARQEAAQKAQEELDTRTEHDVLAFEWLQSLLVDLVREGHREVPRAHALRACEALHRAQGFGENGIAALQEAFTKATKGNN